MTDTERDLIQRMAEELDTWLMAHHYGGVPPEIQHAATLVAEARALLDQSEPEDKVLARVEFAKRDFDGPFDAILARYCDYWFYSDPERTEVDPVDLCRGAIKLFAQTPAPTPVSERLPGSEDCMDEGWAWFYTPRGDWIKAVLPVSPAYTHWLPHYALPVPAATEKP